MTLKSDELDVLNEIINIGIGDAAAILNEMINSHVELTAPIVEVTSQAQLQERLSSEIGNHLSVVEMGFNGSFSGKSNLVFPYDSAVKLVEMLTGRSEKDSDFETISSGTINEIGNIILNSVMASFSNMVAESLDYDVPVFHDLELPDFLKDDVAKDGNIIWGQVNFQASEIKLHGQIILVFEIGTLKKSIQKVQSAAGVLKPQ